VTSFSTMMVSIKNADDLFVLNNFYLIGKLKRTDAVQKLGIKSAISNYDVLAEDDIASAAEFIAACLSLDPASRPSAHDLMYHPWVRDADWCRDYRSPTLRDRPPSQ
jgi:serine/threonine protein kinase